MQVPFACALHGSIALGTPQQTTSKVHASHPVARNVDETFELELELATNGARKRASAAAMGMNYCDRSGGYLANLRRPLFDSDSGLLSVRRVM